MVASLLATMARPVTCPLALTAFLLRGGLVVVVAPIVVLPSAVGLANVLGPAVTRIALGGTIQAIAQIVVGAIVFGLIWLVSLGSLAAAAEAETVRLVGLEEGLISIPDPTLDPRLPGRLVRRIVVIRSLATLPLVLVLAWAVPSLIAATYRELTIPSSLDGPLVERVISGVPLALMAVAIAWMLSQSVAAAAVRATVLVGSDVRDSIRFAVRLVIRRPGAVVVAFALPSAVLGLVVLLAGLAGAAGWSAVRAALTGGTPNFSDALGVLGFVALWLAGLGLISVVAAWRGAVWTTLVAGTIGTIRATWDGRPGDWPRARVSGTLASLRPGEADPRRGEP
ncbi:MAG: hypothetical protein H0U37_05915 [Chloroflexi bacterium]|nr:hypothetical protein [Chloroflexota bacterium]